MTPNLDAIAADARARRDAADCELQRLEACQKLSKARREYLTIEREYWHDVMLRPARLLEREVGT